MFTVTAQNGVLHILRRVTKKLALRHHLNIRILGLEIVTRLYRLHVVTLLVHQVLKLLRGEFQRRLRTLSFRSRTLLRQQDRAIDLKKRNAR